MGSYCLFALGPVIPGGRFATGFPSKGMEYEIMNGDSRHGPAATTASLLLGRLEILQNELGTIGGELITLLRSAGITPSHGEYGTGVDGTGEDATGEDGTGANSVPQSKKPLVRQRPH